VDIAVDAFQVAVDAVSVGRRGYPLQCRQLARTINSGGVAAEAAGDLVVEQAVLGGDLGGRVAGYSSADGGRLENEYLPADLRQQVRGGQPGDAGTQDHHVRLAWQYRVAPGNCRCGVEPQGTLFTADHAGRITASVDG
jgi:hypothetical protein